MRVQNTVIPKCVFYYPKFDIFSEKPGRNFLVNLWELPQRKLCASYPLFRFAAKACWLLCGGLVSSGLLLCIGLADEASLWQLSYLILTGR